MREYWNEDSGFSTNVRFPMIAPLKEAMDRGDDILVISHSLGLVKSIADERIYNVPVREGKSNPHNELGYLIHPPFRAVLRSGWQHNLPATEDCCMGCQR